MNGNLTSINEFRNKKERKQSRVPHKEPTIYPDRINGARVLAQFSIEQASTLTGIPAADLELMESGLLTPDIPQLQSLALGLGFPIEWFYQPPVQGWPGIESTSLRWH